jgi:hypothetical protein
MKTIGFNSEMDKTIVHDKYLAESFDFDTSILTEDDKICILEYLKKNTMVFSMTLALFDEGKFISPYMIFTDGKWLWPSHFEHFVKKNEFKNLSLDFFIDIKKREFKILPLSLPEKSKAVRFIELNLLNIKRRK